MLGWRVVPGVGFGQFMISPHGIMIALGVAAGAWLMLRRARNKGINEDLVLGAVFYGVIGSIVGARIAYVVGHLNQFTSVVEVLEIWRGGISVIGGFLGAFSFGAIYVRIKDSSFFELADLAAPGMGIGVAVGRIGDLLIGDHLGKETSGFWGWQYEGGNLISPPPCFDPATNERIYSTVDGCIAPGVIVHQTATYDLIWSLAIFGIILLLERRPKNRGFLFLSWVGLYAVGRIATDFLRVDKTWFDLGLTGSQMTSILALLVVLFMLVRFRGVPVKASVESPSVSAEPVPALDPVEPVPAPEPVDLKPPPPPQPPPAPNPSELLEWGKEADSTPSEPPVDPENESDDDRPS